MAKRKHKSKIVICLIILIVSFTVFLFIPTTVFYPGSVGGNIGLRPKTNHCIGLSLPEWMVVIIYPKGDIEIPLYTKSIEYWVHAPEDYTEVYCLGQDVWYGE